MFHGVPAEDRNPGVHIMTGPIYVEDARPGDMLEVRYLRMTPRCRYGSNLAANWGYLYKEFGEKERVTIYELDANAGHAEALYAYDFPGKYLVPGTVTHCPACDRQPALAGRAGAGAAAPRHRRAWRWTSPVASAPCRPARMAAISTTGGSAPAR